MWAAIAAVLQAIFGALFAALRLRRQDGERSDAERGRAVEEAARETQEAINETADQRAGIPDSPTDPDDLARELRAERDDGAGGGDRPARKDGPV